MDGIRKYPRTSHIRGSRLQQGDEDLKAFDFNEICDQFLVVEEKVDGANAAISFDQNGELRLQSRGHYLVGGPRERHFALFKQWAHAISNQLKPVLGTRYIMYGEWVYAKHTIFYDALPHYFLEFDICDRETDQFLATNDRQALLTGLPIVSVPILHSGQLNRFEDLVEMVGPSRFKSPNWRRELLAAATLPPHKSDIVAQQTDDSDLMEGLYIKSERDGIVTGRYKYVRQGFIATVLSSESHWQSRPILPNKLAHSWDTIMDAL